MLSLLTLIVTLDLKINPQLPTYATYSIMHIDVHEHAGDDLDALWEANPEAAAAVTVVLEQLEADPRAVDKLTTYGDNIVGKDRVNVKPWEAVQKKGNIWRFRILDTAATSYRIVYGYHWQTHQLCVLAIVHKDEFNYDDLQSDIAQRILSDWRTL